MGSGYALEWPLTLDVQGMIADGWRPIPFREFVVKIHSRCDLACDYCYMYEMADQTWRDRPRRMPDEIAGYAAARIGEHARAHGLDSISLTLHGGEPLLAGPDLIARLVRLTREAAGPRVRVDVAIQTNAVGLDEEYLDLFDELGVLVGVSMDGTAQAHDRHRRFAGGRGSFTAVAAGVRRLAQERYQHLFAGLLCAIDLSNDPVETYEALAGFGPPRIDFLLPHGTWASPPPGRLPGVLDTPYADWLITAFDHWYDRPTTSVRLFEDIIHLLLGGSSSGETVGLAPSVVVVIETDGAIEQADQLKAAYPGAPQTGLHVSSDPLDLAMSLPGIVARQLGLRALAPLCQACGIRLVCGGGHYAHRYRPGRGFANPSVYCPDLIRLIGYIRERVRTDIDTSLRRGLQRRRIEVEVEMAVGGGGQCVGMIAAQGPLVPAQGIG
jgi:uncharacterized protein